MQQAVQQAFVLLDDSRTDMAMPTSSRLYTGWMRELSCTRREGLAACLQQAHQLCLQQGLHAVVLADYEWASDLGEGCLRIVLFARMQRLSSAEVEAWLAEHDAHPDPLQAGLFGWQPGLSQARFVADIEAIRAAIACGQTYQVNYTFSFAGWAHGAPVTLYRQLRRRQPAEFGALIGLPGSDAAQTLEWILSCSPELFLRGQGGQITARPMKGTARIGATPEQTRVHAQWLHEDAKNRAENLMIVDLLRNDLGRVAQTGSVRVDQLFQVQAHGEVLQMTSRIQAHLMPDKGLAEVLDAAFPCGSITGAPKHRTQQLIAALETHRRGLYTGAIGWIDALPDTGTGPAGAWDFCFSVPIRTVFLSGSGKPGLHAARLPVGAGIVWDSVALDEWQECHLKSRFATHDLAGFALFETLRCEADGRLPLRAEHWMRLRASAAELGFAFDETAIDQAVDAHVRALPARVHRLRVSLQADGRFMIDSAELEPWPRPTPVHVLLRDQPCRTPAYLRQHKTSLRHDYEMALCEAAAQGAFDALFFTPEGYLTEGARSTVFVKLDGHWYTPPVSEGLLPGIARARILRDPNWKAQERRIHRNELPKAQALMLCNALRGPIEACLLPDQAQAEYEA